MAKLTKEEILHDPDFQKLVAQKNRVSWVLTVLELVLYFGFIALIAYNKPFLAQKVADGSAITIGIPIAVGTIILSWILTGIYIRWANSTYDDMVNNIKAKVGG